MTRKLTIRFLPSLRGRESAKAYQIGKQSLIHQLDK